MGKALDELNAKLSKVKIREKKEFLYLRATFPNIGRKEIALKCKNNAEGRKLALAKAQQIDSKLIIGWRSEDNYLLSVSNEYLTMAEAIAQYTQYYWSINEPTLNRQHAWKKNQTAYFGYLPPDAEFNQANIIKVLESLPPASYKQKQMASLLSPVLKYFKIAIDLKPYKRYQQPKLNLRSLPTPEEIVTAWEQEKYPPHKWGLAIIALFGIRPHEFYRSQLVINGKIPILYINKNSKTNSRTAYTVPIEGIDLTTMDNQWDKIEATTDLTRSNLQLGQNVSEWFRKYPFTPYSLRHAYAVRGAMNSLSPVFLSKWMGHSLEVHYKHYGSLLTDIESQALWRDKFNR